MAPPDLYGMSLVELIKLIASGELTKEALDWAKKRVRELWNERKYGFTPDPELASGLQKVGKSEAYKRAKDCIGNHKYLEIIRLGLRIQKLSSEGQVETIGKIKDDVKRKYGIKGIRVLNMGSTGVLINVIQYLSHVKIYHDYGSEVLGEIFEDILEEWNKITIFHESDYGRDTLEKTIIRYMNLNHDVFFVFAAGNAGVQAIKTIAQLDNQNEIRNRNYMISLSNREEDQTGRVLYSWVFRKIEAF